MIAQIAKLTGPILSISKQVDATPEHPRATVQRQAWEVRQPEARISDKGPLARTGEHKPVNRIRNHCATEGLRLITASVRTRASTNDIRKRQLELRPGWEFSTPGRTCPHPICGTGRGSNKPVGQGAAPVLLHCRIQHCNESAHSLADADSSGSGRTGDECAHCARNERLRIFPVAFFGRDSTNTMSLGTL